MLKKAFIILFCGLWLMGGAPPAAAFEPENDYPDASQAVNVYFFWGQGCPHCENEKIFLNELAKTYPEVNVLDFEVWSSSANRKLMTAAAARLGANVTGVPFTVIGDRYFIGWQNSMASEFIEAVECVRDGLCADSLSDLTAENVLKPAKNPLPEKFIDLPFWGEINAADFSLPILTVIIAALDGFNPCAMWTLIFLIGLLVNMKNKRRMWILGGAFILTSAAFYFGILAAWLNLLLFLGFIFWVRVLIGLVALGGGGYYLKEFFTNKDNVCKVTNNEKRLKTMEKLKAITQKQQFWLALGGIILLALAVNMIELICSAGLPAVYTQILALSPIATWQYYAYISLYVLVFMLDDLFIFIVAMTTLQVTGLTAKYSRASHLIGGIVMVFIGLLLLFKPEWLMFG